MESIGFIQWCLDNLNYWTITLLMAIESSIIPLPSELVVPPAAYKAAAGELNIYLVVFFSNPRGSYRLCYQLFSCCIYRTSDCLPFCQQPIWTYVAD